MSELLIITLSILCLDFQGVARDEIQQQKCMSFMKQCMKTVEDVDRCYDAYRQKNTYVSPAYTPKGQSSLAAEESSDASRSYRPGGLQMRGVREGMSPLQKSHECEPGAEKRVPHGPRGACCGRKRSNGL